MHSQSSLRLSGKLRRNQACARVSCRPTGPGSSAAATSTTPGPTTSTTTTRVPVASVLAGSGSLVFDQPVLQCEVDFARAAMRSGNAEINDCFAPDGTGNALGAVGLEPAQRLHQVEHGIHGGRSAGQGNQQRPWRFELGAFGCQSGQAEKHHRRHHRAEREHPE